MRAFEYLRAADVAQAVTAVTTHRNAAYLAGGTTQIDLMKDGVFEPDQLVDITRLPLRIGSAGGFVISTRAAVTYRGSKPNDGIRALTLTQRDSPCHEGGY